MLRGPLVSNSSIILCTHQLSAVQQADHVILLERLAASPMMTSTAAFATDPALLVSKAARVAFSGHPKDFNRKYPEYTLHSSANELAALEKKDAAAEKDKDGK